MHIRINTTSGAYSLTVNPNDTVSTVLARIEGKPISIQEESWNEIQLQNCQSLSNTVRHRRPNSWPWKTPATKQRGGTWSVVRNPEYVPDCDLLCTEKVLSNPFLIAYVINATIDLELIIARYKERYNNTLLERKNLIADAVSLQRLLCPNTTAILPTTVNAHQVASAAIIQADWIIKPYNMVPVLTTISLTPRTKRQSELLNEAKRTKALCSEAFYNYVENYRPAIKTSNSRAPCLNDSKLDRVQNIPIHRSVRLQSRLACAIVTEYLEGHSKTPTFGTVERPLNSMARNSVTVDNQLTPAVMDSILSSDVKRLFNSLVEQCNTFSFFDESGHSLLYTKHPSFMIDPADISTLEQLATIIPGIYLESDTRQWTILSVSLSASPKDNRGNIVRVREKCLKFLTNTSTNTYTRVITTLICMGSLLYNIYNRDIWNEDITAIINIAFFHKLVVYKDFHTRKFDDIPPFDETLWIFQNFCRKYNITIFGDNRIKTFDIIYLLKCVSREVRNTTFSDNVTVNYTIFGQFVNALGTTDTPMKFKGFRHIKSLCEIKYRSHSRIAGTPYGRKASIRNIQAYTPLRKRISIDDAIRLRKLSNRCEFEHESGSLAELLGDIQFDDYVPLDDEDTLICLALKLIKGKPIQYRNMTYHPGDSLHPNITQFIYHILDSQQSISADRQRRAELITVKNTTIFNSACASVSRKYCGNSFTCTTSDPKMAQLKAKSDVHDTVRRQLLQSTGFESSITRFIMLMLKSQNYLKHPNQERLEVAKRMLLGLYNSLKDVHSRILVSQMYDKEYGNRQQNNEVEYIMRFWPQDDIYRCHMVCNLLAFSLITNQCDRWAAEDSEIAIREAEYRAREAEDRAFRAELMISNLMKQRHDSAYGSDTELLL